MFKEKTVLTLPLNVPVAGEPINFLPYASVWPVFMVCETDALSLFTLLNSLPCSEGSKLHALSFQSMFQSLKALTVKANRFILRRQRVTPIN